MIGEKGLKEHMKEDGMWYRGCKKKKTIKCEDVGGRRRRREDKRAGGRGVAAKVV